MKKLLTLLAVSPLAITACGPSNDLFARIERDNETPATDEVKAAFVAMLEAATGKKYDENDGTNLKDGDGNTLDLDKVGIIEGDWIGSSTSLFQDSDIENLTMAQAYRAALHFGVNTVGSFVNIGAENGVLVNGMVTKDVAYSAETTPAAYFPKEAKAIVEALKETGDYDGTVGLDTFVTPGGVADIGATMQQDLKAIGVTIKLSSMDSPTFWEKAAGKQHDAFISSWGTVTGHAGYGLYGPFHSNAQGYGGNIQFLASDTVDQALEAGQWATDPTADYLTAQEEISKEFSTVPLYSGNRRFLIQNVETDLTDSGIIQRKTHHEFGDIEVSHTDGVFTVASHGAFRTLHPKSANDGFSNLVNNHLYETLWVQNSDGLSSDPDAAATFHSTLIVEDMAATDGSAPTLTDGRVTLTLKDDILWSDGNTMTVQEVIDSINGTVNASAMSGVTPGVLGAEPHTDANKFTLVFGDAKDGISKGEWFNADGSVDESKTNIKNFSAWRETLAHTGFMMTKTALEDHNQSTNDSDRNIIGTGRYTIEGITSAGHVTLKAKDDTEYKHNSIALNNKVVINAIPDETSAVSAFNEGSVDFVTSVNANIWESKNDNEKGEFTTFGLAYIGFNVDQ